MDLSESINYDTYMKSGGDSYVKLSDGYTNYELSGPQEAKHTLVLIHGGTIPLCIWEPQMEIFRKAGFRILRYDQYGKGFSSRPDTKYSRDLYCRQLKELLESLNITSPVDIVGPSFGGAIGVTFASKYPEKVRSLLLISPALNLLNSDSPLSMPIKLMRIKFFGKLIYKLIIKKKLVSRACTLIAGGEDSPCRRRFINQFKCIGTDKGLLSMFAGDAYESYRESTRIAGMHINNILLLRGKNDQEITSSMINQIREDLPQCQFVEIENSGHSPGSESPDILNKLIIDFVMRT